MEIILELHQSDNFFTLDFQDIYQYVKEYETADVELAYYIERWCEYLNYPIHHNNEMAFGDVELARLEGWITGYNHAKKINVSHFTDRVEIKMHKHFIILKKPYNNQKTRG